MFTGIISGIGHITRCTALGPSAAHGKRLWIETPRGYLAGVALGDSIALNGACMTVAELGPSGFAVDISAESLDKTTGLGHAPAHVNLEKALRSGEPLGGHLVAGHVDGCAEVLSFAPQGESKTLCLQVPAELARFCAVKGSITVNGVSLTLNRVRDTQSGCVVEINVIPHTLAHTTLGRLRCADKVNIEIDSLARYVERMLACKNAAVETAQKERVARES